MNYRTLFSQVCRLQTDLFFYLGLALVTTSMCLGAKLKSAFDFSTTGLVLLCIPLRCSSQVRDMFLASILHTMHAIWLARNILWFGIWKISLCAAQRFIGSTIALSGNYSNGNCLPFDSGFLDSFLVSPKDPRFRDIVTIYW